MRSTSYTHSKDLFVSLSCQRNRGERESERGRREGGQRGEKEQQKDFAGKQGVKEGDLKEEEEGETEKTWNRRLRNRRGSAEEEDEEGEGEEMEAERDSRAPALL